MNRYFTLSKLGLLVGVLQMMLLDVAIFIVLYVVVLVSCTMLFIGIASTEILSPTCEIDELTALPGHPDASTMYIKCKVCICKRECARVACDVTMKEVIVEGQRSLMDSAALTVTSFSVAGFRRRCSPMPA